MSEQENPIADPSAIPEAADPAEGVPSTGEGDGTVVSDELAAETLASCGDGADVLPGAEAIANDIDATILADAVAEGGEDPEATEDELEEDDSVPNGGGPAPAQPLTEEPVAAEKAPSKFN